MNSMPCAVAATFVTFVSFVVKFFSDAEVMR